MKKNNSGQGRRKKTKAQVKKAKLKFQQKRNTQINNYNKQKQAYEQFEQMRADVDRRVKIVQSVYNSKKDEISAVVDGKLVLNEENVVFNEEDSILYWKEDNNPLFSGLDDFASLSKYTKDFVNNVFAMIYEKEQETVADLEEFEDFELIEETEEPVEEKTSEK